MNRSAKRLEDAARVRRVRAELSRALRQGIDTPGFAGVAAVKEYLASGQVEEAKKALDRLTKEQD